MGKAVGKGDARIEIDHIHWYVPHYISTIQKQGNLPKQILSKTPTELRYFERSVFLKEVKNHNLKSSNWVVNAAWIFVYGLF